MKNNIYFFLVVLSVVIIDQLSKYFIGQYLFINENVQIIPSILSFTYTKNTGAAFSLFSGHVQLLTIVSLIATTLILFYYLNNSKKLTIIEINGWSLILGGTIGNMLDRLFLGSVTDFINFTIINFPIFNFADICIDLGAFIVVIYMLFQWKNETKSDKN